MLLEYGSKTVLGYRASIIINLLALCCYILEELCPSELSPKLAVEALEHLEPSIDVHLVVEGAVVATSESGLPALEVQTLALSHHVGLVLSEVQDLTRVDLAADCLMEVFVGDLAVTVLVELVEDGLELLVR